jgi:MFS family permease
MSEADHVGRGATADQQVGTDTPAYRRLWLAWTVSLFGDGVRGLALPLYVALQTKSPLAASAVTVAEVLPWLLMALPAGAIVDRTPARLVVVVAHLTRTALTAGLVVAIVTGSASVPVMCVFAFTLATAETFAYPASQVLLVELAGPRHLKKANSQFYTVHTIGINLAGPLAAGLVLTVDPAIAFGIDGLTFLAAAMLVAGLPAGTTVRAARAGQGPTRLRTDVWHGIKVLIRIPGLRSLVLVITAATIAVAALNAMTPLYAVRTLHMTPAVVSTILIVMALGTLVGARLVVPLERHVSDGPLLVGSMALVATGMIIFGAVPSSVTAWLGNAVLGIGMGAFNVLAAARRQQITPPEAMGRVSGAYRMLAWGLMPIGAGVAGPIAVATSLGLVFVFAGGFILLVLASLSRQLLRTEPAPVPAPRAEPSRPHATPASVEQSRPRAQ